MAEDMWRKIESRAEARGWRSLSQRCEQVAWSTPQNDSRSLPHLPGRTLVIRELARCRHFELTPRSFLLR
jgi:hypothetical protein